MDLKNVSLSHATMRNEHLIPAFAEFLENNFPHEYKTLLAGYGNEDYYYILEFGNYETETAFWLLESLFDVLNEVAPTGFYFGAHQGDGSDYGFWEVYDD